jgi:hypothetical protein
MTRDRLRRVREQALPLSRRPVVPGAELYGEAAIVIGGAIGTA